MNEESPFPRANDKLKEIEKVFNYIILELEKEGITVIRSNNDGTIITAQKVPEKIGLRLREYAEDKDFLIKFSTV